MHDKIGAKAKIWKGKCMYNEKESKSMLVFKLRGDRESINTSWPHQSAFSFTIRKQRSDKIEVTEEQKLSTILERFLSFPADKLDVLPQSWKCFPWPKNNPGEFSLFLAALIFFHGSTFSKCIRAKKTIFFSSSRALGGTESGYVKLSTSHMNLTFEDLAIVQVYQWHRLHRGGQGFEDPETALKDLDSPRKPVNWNNIIKELGITCAKETN